MQGAASTFALRPEGHFEGRFPRLACRAGQHDESLIRPRLVSPPVNPRNASQNALVVDVQAACQGSQTRIAQGFNFDPANMAGYRESRICNLTCIQLT